MNAREPLPPPSPLTLPKTALPNAPPPFVIKLAMALRSMLQVGASRFMTKPFTPEALLSEVRALLGGAAA